MFLGKRCESSVLYRCLQFQKVSLMVKNKGREKIFENYGLRDLDGELVSLRRSGKRRRKAEFAKMLNQGIY